MAEVTGQIIGSDGTKDVRLNNAATESTLKALLANSSIDTASLRAIAAKAGIDNVTLNNLSNEAAASSVSIQRATVSTEQLATSQNKLKEHSQMVDSSFAGLIDSARLLASGNATVSGVLSAFRTLPGPIGLVAQGFSALASFQENNMKTYQTMSSAGANFGGSLTDMRLAAQGTFVDLQTFGNLIKNNSQVLGRMGGTVDEGARVFAAMSNSLLTSNAGKNLLALGYTTEDVNQGMLGYMAATGGRSKEELKNTQAITASTAAYLTELDDLAQITGVSRKEQEEKLKEATANQAFQSYLLTLDEEGRKKAIIGMAESMSKGGKGAAEALQAELMGFPPLTKAAQEFTAIAPVMAASNKKIADAVNDTSKSVTDVKNAGNEMNIAANQTKKDLGDVGNVMIMQGGSFSETIGTIFGTANRNAQQGVNSLEDSEKQRKTLEDNRKTREESQAAEMAKAEIQLKEFGLAIMKLVSPILSVLTPVLTYLGPLFLGLAASVMVWKTAMMAKEAFKETRERAQVARDLAKESGKGIFTTAKNFIELGSGPAKKTVAGTVEKGVAGAAGELIPGAAATSSSGGILGKVLGGLADGLKQMGDPKVMLGIVSVGLLGGAMMIAGKAFKEFSGVSWGDVLIGSVVLTGLAVGAAALVEIAPFIAISAVAIGLLGGAIYLLAKGLKEFPSFAIPGMSEAFTGFGKIVGTVFGFVGGIITGLIDTVKAVFGTVWDIISWPFKQIGNLLSGTVSVIKGIFGTVWDIVSWPFKQLGNLVSFTVDGITSVFKGMVDGISAVFGTVWTIISWPFKMIGSLVSNVFEGISNAIKFVVDKLSNVLGMIGSVIKGVAGFVGRLFGGSDDKEDKDKKGGLSSPEFAKATAVLYEAAIKMNAAGDKLMAGAGSIGKNSAVAGSSMFDSVLSATGINKAVSDIKQKALNLPPISEEAKKIASTFTEDTGPSLEEKTHTELVSLNSTMKDLLRYIKDTADNTRKTHEATKSLNGNAFAA